MKIGIVNRESATAAVIRRIVESTGRHQVLWLTCNESEAVKRCGAEKPNLVLMDIVLTEGTGVEATRRIVAQSGCVVLIVTAEVSANTAKVFEALGAGAMDVVNTPTEGDAAGAESLLKKIEMVERLVFGISRDKSKSSVPTPTTSLVEKENLLVAIGASAGGPMAVAEVLSRLPTDFPAALVIVQHLDAQFADGLADWLNGQSTLPVRVAREGEKPAKGTVLVAGKNDHLTLVDGSTLRYTPHPLDYVYRPSIDVFFKSVVQYWKGGAVGVLLTGMGRDGAQGLKMLRDTGCHTIAQDQASCLVYGMPKAAVALEAAVEILPLHQIGFALAKCL